MEFGSRCPICGKRPKNYALNIPLAPFVPPCSCMIGETDASRPMVIETWEHIVKRYKIKSKGQEAPTMEVTYKGYTGWPLELKRRVCIDPKADDRYDLKLWDSDASALISFTGVKFEDMKFHGGAVTFGG